MLVQLYEVVCWFFPTHQIWWLDPQARNAAPFHMPTTTYLVLQYEVYILRKPPAKTSLSLLVFLREATLQVS